MWTVVMDGELLEWVKQRPEDWWASSGAAVYTWGNGSWNQLGHGEAVENVSPAPAQDWKDVQQVSKDHTPFGCCTCDCVHSDCGRELLHLCCEV